MEYSGRTSPRKHHLNESYDYSSFYKLRMVVTAQENILNQRKLMGKVTKERAMIHVTKAFLSTEIK